MESKIYQSSLLNTYVVGDIVTDTSVTPNLIRIPGLLPMPVNTFVGVSSHNPAVEVQQVYTIGQAVPPTVVANTRYVVEIGNTGNVTNGATNQLYRATYNSPSVLTGTAATDRQNLYQALADRINGNQTVYATAYPLATISHDAGTLAGTPWVAGETLTAPSGASGLVVSGTLNGAGTTVVAMTTTTQFASAELVTSSGGGTATTNLATVVGVGLRIVDDAGYYPVNNSSRTGANTVVLPSSPSSAWVSPSTQLVQTTAPVYSLGQGAKLLQMVPTLERTSPNLASGTWAMATNNSPVSAATYQQFVFTDTPPAYTGELGATSGSTQRIQVLWLQKTTDGTTPNANYAATAAAINAL